MKDLKVFESEKFGAIRTLVDDEGNALFVGKDVAEVLGYTNATKAAARHVDDRDKLYVQIGNTGQKRKTLLITISGVFKLVMTSKLETARDFQHWVTSEVLPQIYRTGGYIPTDGDDDEVTLLSKALRIAEKQLEELQPKVDYYDEVLACPTCYTMTQVAKSLSMTHTELVAVLHKKRIVYSQSGMYMLYKPYLKKGYEGYRTRSMKDVLGADGPLSDTRLVWTEKGREFVIKCLTKPFLPPVKGS